MSLSFVSPARFAGSCLSLVLLILTLALAPSVAQAQVPSISVDDVSISEGNSGAKHAVFTVSLSAPSAQDVTFWVSTAEVSAVGNDDFSHYYSSNYTIPAGQTTYPLNLVIFGDTVMETDETFQVLLEGVANASVAKGVGIGTIVNDDAGAAPTLMIGNLWTVEGNSGSRSASFTVQLSQPAATDVSFSVATANGTASAGSDYTALNLSNQVIPAGQLRKTVSVTIAGDTSTEKNETFLVNLSNAVGATIGRSQGVGTIGNDDSVSAVKIYVSDAYVQERSSGPQTATFYVGLSQAAASTVTFDIKTEDSSATAASGDYVAMSLTNQTLAAGQTSKMYTVTVNGDTLEEADERFIVTLSNISTNAALEYSDPHGVASIPNDDATLSIGDASVLEGDGGTTYLKFPVTLSAPVTDQVQFHYLTCDGTATVAAGDYWATGDAYFTYFPANTTTMMVSVSVNGDLTLEDDETLCVNLTDVGGAAVGNSHAIGTILNDDLPPPTVNIGDASVLEGNDSIQALNFPVSFTHAAKSTVAVSYHSETCGGAAQPDINVPYTPGDYIPTVSGTIWVPPGLTNFSVSLGVRGDIAYEPDEQLCMKLDSATGAVLGNTTGIGTILNDDVLPKLSISDGSLIERSAGITSAMEFAVQLDKASSTDVSFDVVTDYGTAVPGEDFVSTKLVGITIPAGQGYKMIEIPIKGDDEVEADETFSVNLVNVVGTPVGRGQGRGTIINDDFPKLSISDATVVEGDDGTKTAVFEVRLSRPATRPVNFTVNTSDGTATPGTDYVALNYVSRYIDVGRSRVVVEVTINGDTVSEPDESFVVWIGSLSYAFAADGIGVGTIQNDDAPSLTSIARIQGSSASSPLLGQDVATEGVVTAITDQGFFLQSADDEQDGDLATAEGLFVPTVTAAVAVGDRVRATGRVQEVQIDPASGQSTQTQVAASKVLVLGHGQPLPRAIALQDDTGPAVRPINSGLERLEGMRVSVSPLTVRAPSGGSIDERNSRVRSDGRFYAVVRGGDARPQRLRIASAGQRGARALSADAGDVVTGLVGVLGDDGDAYEFLPDPSAAIRIASMARPSAVAAAGNEAGLGSFNLRRFFDSSRQGGEPVLAPDAYATRLAKTANAICAYAGSPAILGLQEVENAQVLGDLAAAVNSRAGNVLFPNACPRDPAYVALRDSSRPGSRLGLLVSTAPVRPGVPRVEVRSLASQAGTETFVGRDGGREPLFESAPLLVQARIHGEGGEVLDLAVILAQFSDLDDRSDSANHGWPKRADYLRARSNAQAKALERVIRAQQKAQPRQPLVLLADTGALPAALGLTDLTDARYSVVRDGEAKAVDRILVNQRLLDSAFGARVEFARINADFGEDNYSDAGVPMRSSDHDPLVLFLRLH